MPQQAKSKYTARAQRVGAKSSTKGDPIFAAIQAHIDARKAFDMAVEEEGKFDLKPISKDPVLNLGGGPLSVVRHPGDADRLAAEVLRSATERLGPKLAGRFIRPATRKVGKLLKERWRQEHRNLERERDRVGFNEAEREWARTNTAMNDALEKLTQTKPTTRAGIVFLAEYAAEIYENHLEGDRNASVKQLLETIRDAAAKA